MVELTIYAVYYDMENSTPDAYMCYLRDAEAVLENYPHGDAVPFKCTSELWNQLNPFGGEGKKVKLALEEGK